MWGEENDPGPARPIDWLITALALGVVVALVACHFGWLA